MKLKIKLQKSLKPDVKATILKDVKSGACSKQHAIITLYTAGFSVKEIHEQFIAAEIKMIYNHVYNVVSKNWKKEDHDNTKATTKKDYFA